MTVLEDDTWADDAWPMARASRTGLDDVQMRSANKRQQDEDEDEYDLGYDDDLGADLVRNVSQRRRSQGDATKSKEADAPLWKSDWKLSAKELKEGKMLSLVTIMAQHQLATVLQAKVANAGCGV